MPGLMPFPFKFQTLDSHPAVLLNTLQTLSQAGAPKTCQDSYPSLSDTPKQALLSSSASLISSVPEEQEVLDGRRDAAQSADSTGQPQTSRGAADSGHLL